MIQFSSNDKILHFLFKDMNHPMVPHVLSQLLGYLKDIEGDTVTINCKELKSLDAGGLGVIVLVYIYLKKNGKRLNLQNLSEQPKNLLIALDIYSFFKEDEICPHQYDLQNV